MRALGKLDRRQGWGGAGERGRVQACVLAQGETWAAGWRPGLHSGSGGPLQEGMATHPLQYSCLEDPMERGAWWATVHGVTKTQTRLSKQYKGIRAKGQTL